MANPEGSSKHQLTLEQQRIIYLEKEVEQLKEENEILRIVQVYLISN